MAMLSKSKRFHLSHKLLPSIAVVPFSRSSHLHVRVRCLKRFLDRSADDGRGGGKGGRLTSKSRRRRRRRYCGRSPTDVQLPLRCKCDIEEERYCCYLDYSTINPIYWAMHRSCKHCDHECFNLTNCRGDL